MSQNASDRKGLLRFGCILEQLELLESHIAANAPTSEAARDLAALHVSKDRPLDNWAYKATPGDFRSRKTRLVWRASSPCAF
jgi:hypothetical protein